LQYAGRHYLQFAGSGEYFLKLGADSPETLLAYADFDGTVARKPQVPLHTFVPHLQDWKSGDPTWKDGKGKGLVGAINYLAAKGVKSISFLPYNAGGDGDNVWPFVTRDDKFHYDVSKLDQWQIVFDYAQQKGVYLHSARKDRRQPAGNRSSESRLRAQVAASSRRGPSQNPGREIRAGAEALHPRACGPIRLRAGAELEYRGREHAVERAAAGDGHESEGHRSLWRPSHRRAHVPERAGGYLPITSGRPFALYRRFAADGMERGPRADAEMAARVCPIEEAMGCDQRLRPAFGMGPTGLRRFRRRAPATAGYTPTTCKNAL
jgi:hypothetical protein